MVLVSFEQLSSRLWLVKLIPAMAISWGLVCVAMMERIRLVDEGWQSDSEYRWRVRGRELFDAFVPDNENIMIESQRRELGL